MTDTYAKVVNGVVVAYPYTDRQLRLDNPNVSFPSAMTDEDRSAFGSYPVTFDPPTVEPHRQRDDLRGIEHWAVGDGVVTATYTLHTFTLEERAAEALPRLSQKRWEVETGGVGVMGIVVRTDEVGQAKLTGAMVAMENDPTLIDVDWEAQPGVWIDVDYATLCALSYVVGRHVQACFSRARVISEAIQSASTHAAMDEAIAAIDTGWPD